MSRIAIVDLLFNWPPDGGARTDVKEIASRLSKDHKVCIFVPDFPAYFPRGRIKGRLSLRIKKIPFDLESFYPSRLSSSFRREVDKYNPDFVFIADGWYLKPYLVEALKEYRPILRFYAYEGLCPRGHGHFYKEARACDNDYLNGPIESIFNCTGCALSWIKKLPDKQFRHEFNVAAVLSPYYRNLVKNAIKDAGRIIIYNEFIRKKITPFNKDTIVVPSGVDTRLFKPAGKRRSGKVKILMVGRIEDDLKGFPYLHEACKRLRRRGYRFQLLVTAREGKFREDYITSVGWLSQQKLAKLYQSIDICVVPSVWQEPFGIVALEAISSGKPVIVTRVGGLQSVIEDKKEGFIVEPEDAKGLARRLKQLLDNPRLRREMGEAGRRRAEELYDWDKIYKKYYLPLFSGKEKSAAWESAGRSAKEALHNGLIRGISSGRYAYTGPRTVQIDITNRCNNNCLYCWARSPLLGKRAASREWQSQELPLDKVKSLIDELYSLGTRNIHIAGGGEPFLHAGIMEILAHIKQKGMMCELTTNFTLITEGIIRKLIDLAVESITVSIWAGTPGTYKQLHPNKTEEDFYRITGLLKSAASIKREKKKAYPLFRLCYVISSINFREAEEMIRLAEETRVDYYVFQVMDPVTGYTDKLLLADKEREELKDKLHSLRPVMRELALQHNVKAFEPEEFIRRISSREASAGHYDKGDLDKIPCYAGWVFSRVTAEGNINFCLKTDEYPIANIYKQSFKDIWYSEEYARFREKAFRHALGRNQPLRCGTTCDNRQENMNIHAIMDGGKKAR